MFYLPLVMFLVFATIMLTIWCFLYKRMRQKALEYQAAHAHCHHGPHGHCHRGPHGHYRCASDTPSDSVDTNYAVAIDVVAIPSDFGPSNDTSGCASGDCGGGGFSGGGGDSGGGTSSCD